MKHLIALTLTTFFAVAFSGSSLAENDSENQDKWHAFISTLAPEKSEITDYAMVYFLDVKIGHEDEFESLAKQFFIEGAQLANVSVPTLYSMTTGEFGYMVIYPAKDPGEKFKFSRTQEDVDLLKALAKKYSREEIQNGYDRFYSLIKRSKRIIVGKVAPY